MIGVQRYLALKQSLSRPWVKHQNRALEYIEHTICNNNKIPLQYPLYADLLNFFFGFSINYGQSARERNTLKITTHNTYFSNINVFDLRVCLRVSYFCPMNGYFWREN